MKTFYENIIEKNRSVKEALVQLNKMGDHQSLTLFVVDSDHKLEGTLTDGDIRRGLVNGKDLSSPVGELMYKHFRYLPKNNFSLGEVQNFKQLGIDLVPQLDEAGRLIKLISLGKKKTILPIDAVIMAGGKGLRLKPLTDTIPKSLVRIGDKPILEHNIDRLVDYGVDTIFITVEYLKEQIMDYFSDGSQKEVNIQYIEETAPMGTIGSVKRIQKFNHDYVLIMNSDLLTNIDFEDFFAEFVSKDAGMAVATVPYQVNVPYAVMEIKGDEVVAFKEKPIYTYYANAGIYLIKKKLLDSIPEGAFYNATDLMEKLISEKEKVIYFPILGYWMDIGKHADYEKALKDIHHIKL